MSTTIETYTAAGLTVEIHYDEYPESPRDMFDNVGTIVHWHRGYDFGEDVRSIVERCSSLATFERYLSIMCDAAVVLPLSIIDHSGVHMWVASGRNETSRSDSAGWDSGQVGYIYATREQVRKEWDGDIERAETYLRGEIEEYDYYLTGQVYYYVVVDANGETLDSCGGYYGDLEYVKSAADDAAEACANELRRKAEGHARQRSEAFAGLFGGGA